MLTNRGDYDKLRICGCIMVLFGRCRCCQLLSLYIQWFFVHDRFFWNVITMIIDTEKTWDSILGFVALSVFKQKASRFHKWCFLLFLLQCGRLLFIYLWRRFFLMNSLGKFISEKCIMLLCIDIEPESTLSQLDKLLPIGLRPGVIYSRLSNQMQIDLHTTHCRFYREQLGPTTCKADPVSVLNRSS